MTKGKERKRQGLSSVDLVSIRRNRKGFMGVIRITQIRVGEEQIRNTDWPRATQSRCIRVGDTATHQTIRVIVFAVRTVWSEAMLTEGAVVVRLVRGLHEVVLTSRKLFWQSNAACLLLREND